MIAGSPRNASRGSLGCSIIVVEHWIEENPSGFKSNQTPNAIIYKSRKEAVGAKLHRRKGNNPDHRLRSLRVG